MNRNPSPQRWRPDVDLRDVHVYGGGVIASVGAWLLSPPAALIGLGLLLVWLGLRRI